MTTKRDHYVLWFKHLPEAVVARLNTLQPNQTIELMVDGAPTVWARMRPSGTTPTPGVRLITGRNAWERIALGGEFRISFTPASGDASSERPAEILPRHHEGGPLFGGYEFADFSGARHKGLQRRAIKLAFARGRQEPNEVQRSLTRDGLQEETLKRLLAATKEGTRLAFGRDHQYSIPLGLAAEIGLGNHWRDALSALVRGTYGGPPLSDVAQFAPAFNNWLISRGSQPYFYSYTKAELYGVPKIDPRPSQFGEMNPTTYRLTELARSVSKRAIPKPLNRIGDNGTVGGQTVVGLILLHDLLGSAARLGIPLSVWPFDGLDIRGNGYQGRHVMFEPYPSCVRDIAVLQTDSNDARACVLSIQLADQEDRLCDLLDLSRLSPNQADRVLFEGWIAGHTP